MAKARTNTIYGQDEAVKMLSLASEENVPALIIGDTGTGKTTIVKHLAEKAEKEWIRFNLTGETTVDDFVGKWTLQDGNTKWNDGVLLQAMKQGKWLIVDEINVALPEILTVLHSLLDDDRFIVVANNNGEVVRPAEEFRFFATMNPTEEYAGTKDLNKAFKSRFGIIAYMDYPDVETEVTIINEKTAVGKRQARKLVTLGNKFRQAKKNDEIFYTCSTRDLMQWADMWAKTDDLGLSFKYTVMNKANGDGQTLKTIYEMTNDKLSAIEAESPDLLMEDMERKLQEITSERLELVHEKDRVKRQMTDEIMTELKEKLGMASALIERSQVEAKVQEQSQLKVEGETSDEQ